MRVQQRGKEKIEKERRVRCVARAWREKVQRGKEPRDRYKMRTRGNPKVVSNGEKAWCENHIQPQRQRKPYGENEQ